MGIVEAGEEQRLEPGSVEIPMIELGTMILPQGIEIVLVTPEGKPALAL